MSTQGLLLAYYGDDFTGSTDALEFLSRAGARTVLFMMPPSEEQLQRYPDLTAIGVAGTSRSMTPDVMDRELRPVFSSLKKLGARHVHYKVCSTFDSSPVIGSIGKAIDIATEIFNPLFIPLLVAAPALGRYCLFGNLFARMGIGSSGDVYRLDRHPVMINHPVTPAAESDLRIHLAHQTTQTIGLLNILQLVSEEPEKHLHTLISNGSKIILFDALNEEHISHIGGLLDQFAAGGKTFFSVGSSGVEMALGSQWVSNGHLKPVTQWKNPGKAEPLLVVSGSCSAVTAGQIQWALNQGFAEVALGVDVIADEQNAEVIIEGYSQRIVDLLRDGKNVIVHTSLGTSDPRVAQANEFLISQGIKPSMMGTHTAARYGAVLGSLVNAAIRTIPVRRLLIAGGDTSGFVAGVLGLEGLEMIAPIVPGAPLCRAHAPGSPIDGLEINFKGGQVGAEDYFDRVLQGK